MIMEFPHISAARYHYQQNRDVYTVKKNLRKLFNSEWYQKEKNNKNFGMILKFILNKIHDSKEAFCCVSRDTLALELGMAEKTAEYNVKKMIEYGIVTFDTIPNRRHSGQKVKLLTLNPYFNPKHISRSKKRLSPCKTNSEELKKISQKQNSPKNIFSIKQIDCGLLSDLGKEDFFKLKPAFQAISFLLGSHGIKLDVLPSKNKKLALKYKDINFSDLDTTDKVLYLINHFEKKNSTAQIKVPDGYVMLDCDDREQFDKLLANNYLGGIFIQSPRGGKILCKQDLDLDFEIQGIELHMTGKNDCVLGTGYKILALDEIQNLSDVILEGFSVRKKPLAKKLVDIPELHGKVIIGTRNDYLFRVGRSFKARAEITDRNTMFEVLSAINQEKFTEPLPFNEVYYMAKHIFKYKNRKDFTQHV